MSVSDLFKNPAKQTKPVEVGWNLKTLFFAAAAIFGLIALRHIFMALMWAAIGFGLFVCFQSLQGHNTGSGKGGRSRSTS